MLPRGHRAEQEGRGRCHLVLDQRLLAPGPRDRPGRHQTGARVLEIGTTGYNAAVIAEVAAPGRHVVTLDIDPEVSAWAHAAQEAAGYGDRVSVATDDGEHGVPGHGLFDAIIVTAGAWDVPPSWLAQLADGGTLVVPLRMNGVTRSITFVKDGSHLASTSAVTCGFVPMQGAGGQPETFIQVPAPCGAHITLRYEDDAPAEPPLPDDILASEPATAWSGLTIADRTPWSGIYLRLAGFAPGFCRLDQAGDPHLAGGRPGHEDRLVPLRHRPQRHPLLPDRPRPPQRQRCRVRYRGLRPRRRRGQPPISSATCAHGTHGAATCPRTPSRTGRAGSRHRSGTGR